MKVAVLGSGKMGETVVQHLRECPEVKEIVAYDVAEERIRVMRDQLGLKATTKLQEVLSDPAIRLVFITAANHAHK